MAKNNNLKDYLVDLYQGIASRKPNASKNPQDFRSEIENLVFTSDANAAASDIRAGKTAYVNDVKITGTIKDYDNTYEEGGLAPDMLQIRVDTNNSCEYLFYKYSGTTDDWINNFSRLDTSKVTNMSCMFLDCNNLTTIPQLDTSNVIDMNSMFSRCSKLTTIPQLDTSKATDMNYMFSDCHSLEKIDITKLADAPYVFTHYEDYYIFNNCHSLKTIIIRTMHKVPIINDVLFNGCYHFKGTQNTKYNPSGLKDGKIYVPDYMVEELKSASVWRSFADLIVPLSTLEE